jgi:hypothetical protein
VCLTWCHRRGVLYWNHDDCRRHGCELGGGPHGSCRDCRHCQGEICGLTRCALPGDGTGCCHHDVEPASGPQAVTAAVLAPLGAAAEQLDAAGISRLLDELDYAPHTVASGVVYVDPDQLGVPDAYGVGATEEDDWEPAGVGDWEAGELLGW